MTYYVKEIKKYIIWVSFGAKEYYTRSHSVPIALGLFGDEKVGPIASLSFFNDISKNLRDLYDSMTAIGAGDSPLTCHMSVDEYPRILDLLRKKQPLFFHFNSDSPSVSITTSQEPVGEHEMIHSMVKQRKFRKKRKFINSELFSSES
ncbi:MAG: hypothetical protein LUQ19_05405 [Methanoregula sp.]|nr:hypothetical protein [Methanoregula sp.]